jgi:hypothetical protein
VRGETGRDSHGAHSLSGDGALDYQFHCCEDISADVICLCPILTAYHEPGHVSSRNCGVMDGQGDEKR